jgi:hypothetical protein
LGHVPWVCLVRYTVAEFSLLFLDGFKITDVPDWFWQETKVPGQTSPLPPPWSIDELDAAFVVYCGFGLFNAIGSVRDSPHSRLSILKFRITDTKSAIAIKTPSQTSEGDFAHQRNSQR